MSKPASVVPATSADPVPPTPPTEPTTRTLKIAACPSLSGQSQLTYHIGCNAESAILFRITGNTGAGIFGNEWIALSDIQKVFDAVPPGKLIRSALLAPLFKTTRSSNSPAFILAALISEGLVCATENQGYYLRADPSKFQAEIAALVDAGVDLGEESKPAPGKVATRNKKGAANTDPVGASKGSTVAA